MSEEDTTAPVEEAGSDVVGLGAEDAAATAGDSVGGEKEDPKWKMRLARIASVQGLVLLVSLCLFAAADSWTAVTGLAFASVLGVITGLIAGVVMTSVIHEVFHLLGAQVSGGAYRIPPKVGIFLYDWQFERNSVDQFFVMSIAGSVGGAISVILLWNAVPADTIGRATLRGAAVAAFVYAAIIEWPVLQRTRRTREPLAELSKIDEKVLMRSLYGGLIAGVITIYWVFE
ncbi:MAG: hypothetical protein AB8C02_10310 [Halioglobus sp.]